MVVLRQTVQVYRKDLDTGTWSSTAQDISDAAFDVNVSRSIGKKTDTFNFKITNVANRYFFNTNGFQIDDRIRIYFHPNNNTASTTDLIIDGTIKEISEEQTKGLIQINGESFIDTLFKTYVFIDVKAQTPAELIQTVISRVNIMNRTRSIYGATSSEWTTIGNPTAKGDGSAFPVHDEVTKYTSAIELIEKYSSDQYTKDGAYYFYVSYDVANNRWNFNWKKKTNAVPSGNSITYGVEPIKYSVKKRVDNIINNLILNVGNDPYEHPQEIPVFNATSTKAVGAYTKYVSFTNQITPKLVFEEAKAQIGISPSKWPNYTGSDGTVLPAGKFPDFTTRITISTWTQRNEDGSKKNPAVNIIVSTSANWSAEVRLEAYWKGREEGQRIIDFYSNPRIEADIEIGRTTKSYVVGELYDISAPLFNLPSKSLRCMQIDESIGKQKLSLKEDEDRATFS